MRFHFSTKSVKDQLDLYCHVSNQNLFCSFYCQCDRLSGKPGNVREFDSCQGTVRDFAKNQGNVRGKILSGKSCLNLFIVSCIFASVHSLCNTPAEITERWREHYQNILNHSSVTHIMPVLVLLSVVGVGMQQYMIRNHIINI